MFRRNKTGSLLLLPTCNNALFCQNLNTFIFFHPQIGRFLNLLSHFDVQILNSFRKYLVLELLYEAVCLEEAEATESFVFLLKGS